MPSPASPMAMPKMATKIAPSPFSSPLLLSPSPMFQLLVRKRGDIHIYIILWWDIWDKVDDISHDEMIYRRERLVCPKWITEYHITVITGSLHTRKFFKEYISCMNVIKMKKVWKGWKCLECHWEILHNETGNEHICLADRSAHSRGNEGLTLKRREGCLCHTGKCSSPATTATVWGAPTTPPWQARTGCHATSRVPPQAPRPCLHTEGLLGEYYHPHTLSQGVDWE